MGSTRLAEARKLAEELKGDAQDGTRTSPVSLAMLHAALGEKDQAFEWLETAYLERSAELLNVKTDPAVDPLRPDPRFTSLLNRINLR